MINLEKYRINEIKLKLNIVKIRTLDVIKTRITMKKSVYYSIKNRYNIIFYLKDEK